MGVRAAHDQLVEPRRVGRRSSAELEADEVDLLLISPERLANRRFREEVLAAVGAQRPGWS